MKRRAFLQHAASAALLAAAPIGFAAHTRGRLLDEPHAWTGESFRLADGSVIVLAAVEELSCDLHTRQVRLQFHVRSGTDPAEGTHALASGWREEQVFLQPGVAGPVACVNRLTAAA